MFKRTKGAKSDVSELEYIASLHQTDFKLRRDCSISSTDVQLYLISRYGIQIEKKHVNDVILGLRCGCSDDASEEAITTTTTSSNVIKEEYYGDGFVVKEKKKKGGEEEEEEDDREEEQQEEQLPTAATLVLPAENNHGDDNPYSWQKGHNKDNDKNPKSKATTIREDFPHQQLGQNKQQDTALSDNEEGKEKEQYLDLVQWVSALLVPYFVEMKNASQQDFKTQREIKCQRADIDATLNELRYSREQDSMTCSLSIWTDKVKTWYKEKSLMRQAALLDSKLSFTLESQNVLHVVYDIILRDLQEKTHYGDSKNLDAILNEQTILELLQFYGEMPAAASEQENNNQYDDSNDDRKTATTTCFTSSSTTRGGLLLRQMAECASEKMGSNGSIERVYDFPSFVNALSSDVMLWDINDNSGIEELLLSVYSRCNDNVQASCDAAKSPSIHVYDELGGNCKEMAASETKEEQEKSFIPADLDLESFTSSSLNQNQTTKDEALLKINGIATAPYIDSVTDTQYSVLFVMAVWIYFIFSVSVYMTFINASAYNIIVCDGSFPCTLVNRIWTWLCLGAILTLAGIVIIIPISVANHPFNIGMIRASIAAGAITVFTIVPYVFMKKYTDGAHAHAENGESTHLDRIVQEKWFQFAINTYFAYGLLLLIFIIPKNFVSDYIYKKKNSNCPTAAKSHWVASSNITRSAEIKMATRKKVHQLLQNAYAIHFCNHKSILDAYLGHEDEVDDSGGFIWTWSQLLSRRMLTEQGIWIHSRLAVGMEGQLITFGFLAWILFSKTNDWVNRAEETRARIMATSESGPSKDFALWYIPTAKTIRDSSTVGIVAALSVGAILILLYLPSAVATVLKLRCGTIPSLHDPYYLCYRLSADTTYYNTGNMIYGLIGTQILFFVFFGGITFLALWPVTRSGFLRFLAWFCALMITIILKFLITKILRKKFFKAFFRRNPRAANIYATAYEAWHLGLGGGVLISRLTQFLLAAAFWVGRIDVPFLCKDVHIFGYRFDTAPNNFRKDLLVHEAHRHPYIDRLGLIYLMRLKHGEKFCSSAGCMWRRLFVLALMPWLQKYSIRRDISIPHRDQDFATE